MAGGAGRVVRESQLVEWKETWRDEYLKWICGFANAQGGVLEIGRNDRGEVIGVKDVLRLLEEIPNKALASLGIVVDVNLKIESEREYLQIVVEPYSNTISYKGEFHYRTGSTNQILRGAALSRFLLQRYGRRWDDVPLPGVSLNDLDARTLDEFRSRAAGSGRVDEDIIDDPDTGVIEKLRLREGEYLKRAAVLLFHPVPGALVRDAYVKIGCFRGAEILFQDVIEGNLFTQVDRTMDLLYSKYSRGLVSYKGIYRVETFPITREAMREAVINALIHRDYAATVPIQIRVYDDRIQLWNPGRLPDDWTVERLAEDHASRPYNPQIAYAFFRAGMIEGWGRGIARINSACDAAGNPRPEWRIEPGGVWLEFRYSVAYQAADGVVREGRNGSQPEWKPDSPRESQPESQLESRRDSSSQPEWEQPESVYPDRLQPEWLEGRLLVLLAEGAMAKVALSRSLGQQQVSGQLNKVVRRLVAERMIEYTLPDRPRSRLQRYRLTAKGRAAVTASTRPGTTP